MEWRSWWASWGSEGGPVAERLVDGGDGSCRARERERSRGEGEDGGESGGAVGAIQTALAGLSAAPRKLAGRRWHGRVCAHGEHALGVLLARWRRRLEAPVSWASADGPPGKWPR